MKYINYINNSCNSNNHVGSNNNNNNKNDKRESTYLFNLIWKNKYLKDHIFLFVRIYKMFLYPRIFNSLKSIKECKHKEFLDTIIISNYNLNKNESDNEVKLDNLIPENVCKLYIGSFIFTRIPDWITTIRMDYQSNENLKLLFCRDASLIKNLKSIWFCRNSEVNQEIPPNILPSSTTSLKLDDYNFQLKKDVLPSRLINFEIILNKPMDESYEDDFFQYGSLPSSLKTFTVSAYYQKSNKRFPISMDVLPPSIEKLKVNGFFFTSSVSPSSPSYFASLNNNDENLPTTKSLDFPINLKHLSTEIDNLDIKLPDGIEEVYLTSTKKLSLLKYPLPDSITILSLHSTTKQNIKRSMIPNKVKHLRLQCNKFKNSKDDNLSYFPDSIETLTFLLDSTYGKGFNQRLLQFQLPQSLASLDFTLMSGFNNGSFPLDEENIFPQSLTYINLGSEFNMPIGINVFPRSGNLKTIVLGSRFNHPILLGTIPSSVQLLQINNHQYHHLIEYPNEDNPNILVKFYNITDYLNSFNSNPSILKKIFLPLLPKQLYKEFKLQRYKNLEYLEISGGPNQKILPEDFPTSIKTLNIDCANFKETLNLEDFQQLETIIVNISLPKIITTKTNNKYFNSNNSNNNHNLNNNDQISYNFYNLKSIIVKNINTDFLDSIDSIFYPFIKIIKIL